MDWQRCPRCSSVKVVKVNKWVVSIALGSIGTLVFFVLGFVFPFFFFGVPAAWIFALVLLLGKSALQCQECHFAWDPSQPPPKAQ